MLPTFADINLFKTTQFDSSPLLELFDHNNIKYIHTQNILLYLATPSQIEQLILSSHECDVSSSSSFISFSKKVTFEIEKFSDQIFAKALSSTQYSSLELQIIRKTIGTTSEVFWQSDFISFLRLRFLCQNNPQIKIVRSHGGVIKEVVAFTTL